MNTYLDYIVRSRAYRNLAFVGNLCKIFMKFSLKEKKCYLTFQTGGFLCAIFFSFHKCLYEKYDSYVSSNEARI